MVQKNKYVQGKDEYLLSKKIISKRSREDFKSEITAKRHNSYPTANESKPFYHNPVKYIPRDMPITAGSIDQKLESYHRTTQSTVKESSSAPQTKSFAHNSQPQNHEVTLQRPYIHMIRAGSKTIEGRIDAGFVKRLRIGDTIRFFYHQNPSDCVVCEITSITPYKSFRAMLETEGFKRCIPDAQSLEDAVKIYDKIPSYPERSRQNGVAAIGVKVKI
jgi:ASC-1-like (ASCH) protein